MTDLDFRRASPAIAFLAMGKSDQPNHSDYYNKKARSFFFQFRPLQPACKQCEQGRRIESWVAPQLGRKP